MAILIRRPMLDALQLRRPALDPGTSHKLKGRRFVSGKE
tara:strand:- start:15931 stop:16047 length:117 start_codon:yes stop_codon:yes gene_type:complete